MKIVILNKSNEIGCFNYIFKRVLFDLINYYNYVEYLGVFFFFSSCTVLFFYLQISNLRLCLKDVYQFNLSYIYLR